MRGHDKAFTIVPGELELGPLIGRGASSYVQRALHKPTNTPLAIKVVNVFDKSKRHQLISEIQALYDADCISLVQFFGAYYLEGTIHIALEYMDGGSLANVLKQVKKIPEHALANIVFQILWGLAYLKHEKRLHRDIKPSNLLINSSGLVKLSDFGVSAELQDSIGMADTFTGTFKYMAPERILHQAYTFSSDIWSLGVVLVECATGVYPYEKAQTHIEMAETIVNSEPPHTLLSEFSPQFQDFIACCLHRTPEQRLPADVLLASSWLRMYGATDIASSVIHLRSWINDTRRTLIAADSDKRQNVRTAS